MNTPPIIVAHRGLHHVHPENSLAAFRAAWDAGFEWCECDVQEARGGELVVIHDESLDRTTDGSGPVAQQTLATLTRHRLRRPDGSVTGEGLASLDELLALMRPDEGLLLEIKPNIPKGLLWGALNRLGSRRVIIQSFHEDVVRAANEMRMRTAWLSEDPQWFRRIESSAGASLHMRHDLVQPDLIRRCRAAGKGIGVWTVNAPDDVRRTIGLGVDMIITDEPIRVRDATDARESGT